MVPVYNLFILIMIINTIIHNLNIGIRTDIGKQLQLMKLSAMSQKLAPNQFQLLKIHIIYYIRGRGKSCHRQ